jgi:2-furoyl-CoA dehydrogenase FAD binding subunit
MLNLRLVEADAIIDISRLKELSKIEVKGNVLEIGAAVTQNRLLAWPDLSTRAALLAQMLPFVGHFQTRNRGTVCGSLAHADPSSEIPLALALLGGSVVLESKRGQRVLTANAFQTGILSTARAGDELVVAARFPLGKGKSAFHETARRHGDFAIVSVGAIHAGDKIRLGFGGVSGRPFVTDIPAGDAGKVADRLEEIVWQFDGYEDQHASKRMRRDLVRRMTPLVISELLS